MFSEFYEKSAARYLSRYADESRPAIIAVRNYIDSKSKAEPILMSLLADIITAKFNAGPINTPEVTEALMAYFQFYCTPQFEFPDGAIAKMVAPPDNMQALWEDHHIRLEELYQLSIRHSKHKIFRQGDRLVDAQKLIV